MSLTNEAMLTRCIEYISELRRNEPEYLEDIEGALAYARQLNEEEKQKNER